MLFELVFGWCFFSRFDRIVYDLSIKKSPGESMSGITPMSRRKIHSSSDLPRSNQDILYDVGRLSIFLTTL